MPKTYIPNYSEFYEARHFTSGKNKDGYVMIGEEEVPFGTEILFNCVNFETLVLQSKFARICGFLIHQVQAMLLQEPQLLQTFQQVTKQQEKIFTEPGLVSGQSARTLSAYIYADAGEGESTTDLVFAGHNIIAENGNILSQY